MGITVSESHINREKMIEFESNVSEDSLKGYNFELDPSATDSSSEHDSCTSVIVISGLENVVEMECMNVAKHMKTMDLPINAKRH